MLLNVKLPTELPSAETEIKKIEILFLNWKQFKMLSADFFNQVKKELGADVAKNVFQIAKEHSVGAGYTSHESSQGAPIGSHVPQGTPQGAPIGSQEDYVVLDTPEEKPSSIPKNVECVRIIGDPIPKEGVVAGNTNTIPKEGVLVDTKENKEENLKYILINGDRIPIVPEKEEKVLLRDDALKHPQWGPRIKEVIVPLQKLAFKGTELCWDSVDFKNGVGSIWAWYQPKGGQWMMNVYLDKVEIRHEHNPKYKDEYRSIPLNELESEFRSFLDGCVIDLASSEKNYPPKIYDDRLSTLFGTSNPEEIKNLDLDDYRTKFETAQKQLNALISDPEEYKKIRIQKIEEMLSTFRDSQGPHFSAINLYVDTSRSTNSYFLQFLVRSDMSYANYSYRLLVGIRKESGKALEKLFQKSEVKLFNTAVTPYMHVEICKISDDKKWGLIVVDNEIPDRSYGYYGDLSIDSYPFPVEDVQKLSL